MAEQIEPQLRSDLKKAVAQMAAGCNEHLREAAKTLRRVYDEHGRSEDVTTRIVAIEAAPELPDEIVPGMVWRCTDSDNGVEVIVVTALENGCYTHVHVPRSGQTLEWTSGSKKRFRDLLPKNAKLIHDPRGGAA